MTALCTLGRSKLDPDSNVLLVQCKDTPLSEDESDAPDFGEAADMSCLGVTARPYPADEDGNAEGVVLDDVPGIDGVLVGARDTRSASIVGTLAEGDTVLHSTGPQTASAVYCKEAKRQTVMRTKDTQDKDAVIMLDGVNDKAAIAAFGMSVQVSRSDGIVLTDGTAAIQIKDGIVSITGKVVWGGRNVLGSVYGGPPGTPAASLVPIPGVFYGA